MSRDVTENKKNDKRRTFSLVREMDKGVLEGKRPGGRYSRKKKRDTTPREWEGITYPEQLF